MAFITALQVLPPRHRAVLVLRDVLGFRAAEVADILETALESVTSALKRARTALARELPPSDQPPPSAQLRIERAVLQKLVAAFESGESRRSFRP